MQKKSHRKKYNTMYFERNLLFNKYEFFPSGKNSGVEGHCKGEKANPLGSLHVFLFILIVYSKNYL